ncbi:MAG TPA: AMP-dependent synthetase [Planctomycetaceae bacterium]|nr:AMP-dependent synthetase [Planctomycetaceae bacterium]
MNVGQFLTKAARDFPSRPGIVHGTQSWSYAEFNQRTSRLCHALQEQGLERGDNVAVLMTNCGPMLETMFAGFRLGCGVVPINFRLHPNEFAYIIDHSESRIVVTSPEFNEPLRSVADQMPRVEHVITTDGAIGDELDYETILEGQPGECPDAEVDPDDVAWLFYTSGTTGRPKGAMLTHRNLEAMSTGFFTDMCPDRSQPEATLHAAPLSHGSGLYALPNVAMAATHVIPSATSFDPADIFECIQRHQITNIFVAPTMLKRLIDHPDIGRFDLGSLKSVIYGGAPMLVEDLLRALEQLGPCLVQLYGQGESPMTITYLPHQDHVSDGNETRHRRLGSAGIARTDVEVGIVDDNDRRLGTGEVGEIVTRSDLVMKGYWRDPDASDNSLRGGWLHTGDVGYLDEDGYLFLMDRSHDMIISGGENIYPREIEEVLVRHPAVHEVAVIGIPDEEWGEAVKAVVSTVDGGEVTEEELIEFCRDHIASYKKPRSVDFVDELPRNNYGKIVKRELREAYWQGRERRV